MTGQTSALKFAADAARRWAAAMKARPRQSIPPGRVLAPWDENVYFQMPTETDVSIGPGNNQPLVNADLQRVALIFSAQITGPGINISINPNAVGGAGLQLQGTTSPVSLLQQDYGPLVTMQWFVSNLTGVPVTVTFIEVKLRAWPGG
jgi:hypothetical protein